MLAAQGLLHPPAQPAVKIDVLQAIRRMGALQIDTIHVVARSPYLSLFSRLGSYDPRWLDELLAEGTLFEYWSHAASFLPSEDYPYYRRMMLTPGYGWNNREAWEVEHPQVSEKVLERIRQEGALRSADFENPDHKGGTWWNWKEEKMALEHLLTAGVVMVARREKFQRLYDLRQRILPDWDDARTPSHEEVRRALAIKTVRALGIARVDWVPDYFRISKKGISELLHVLAAEGHLLEISVEGWDAPVYAHPEHSGLLACAASGQLSASLTTLLSPFDALIWDRRRTRELFDFDFTLECYLPAEKRRYGYFCLPVLQRGRLVGRADAKAHRQAGLFEVKTLYLEPGVTMTDELQADIQDALQRCAEWHGTPEVLVRNIVRMGDEHPSPALAGGARVECPEAGG
jgi:uncharacterized protein YcaQ